MVQFSSILAALVASTSVVQAHPGESHAQKTAEMDRRNDYIRSMENTDLVHCKGKLVARGEVQSTVERRETILKTLRRERGLSENEPHYRVKRQMPPPKGPPEAAPGKAPGGGPPKGKDFNWFRLPPPTMPAHLNRSHHSVVAMADPLKADWALLGQNRTTLLSPSVTEGPYYVSGEMIRQDVRDKETGIDLHLDIQVVDMNTCTPMQNQAVEIWASNATGVYSGVLDFLDMGNKANINNRALRGVQVTDKNGAVQFKTIIPGHYLGRTNHIHVATHLNATIHANKTISGGTVPHVGQLYFDEDLIDLVTAKPPYTANKFPRMRNHQDRLMIMGAGGGADPIVEYVLLGKDLKDGVFAWINFGVNGTLNRNIRAATACTPEGCKNGMADFLAGPLGQWLGSLFTPKAAGNAPVAPKAAGNAPAAAPKGS